MTLLHTMAAFIVALGVLIVVHEYGHYVVARLCGVKVLRFSVGFGRPLVTWRRGRDRTEWVIAAIPFGGYVKMLDEREAPVAPHEAVRAFLKGWVNTIALMRKDKAKAVEITSKVVKLKPSVVSRAYDDQIGIFSTDGAFDPKAVAMLKKTFVEMGLLKEEPDDKVLFTTQFLPVKPDM